MNLSFRIKLRDQNAYFTFKVYNILDATSNKQSGCRIITFWKPPSSAITKAHRGASASATSALWRSAPPDSEDALCLHSRPTDWPFPNPHYETRKVALGWGSNQEAPLWKMLNDELRRVTNSTRPCLQSYTFISSWKMLCEHACSWQRAAREQSGPTGRRRQVVGGHGVVAASAPHVFIQFV
jgi:hypothetical protein